MFIEKYSFQVYLSGDSISKDNFTENKSDFEK